MDLDEKEHQRRKEWETRILTNVRAWRKSPLPPKPWDLEERRFEDQQEAKTPFPKKKDSPIADLLVGLFKGQHHHYEEDVEEKPMKKRKKAEVPKASRPRPTDSYGYMVTEIVLRKDVISSTSFMSYDTRKHPLNNCLFETEHNPLTKKCEPDTIRYFHFPANNMHWIEVIRLSG